MAQYSFLTTWRLEAPIEAVWDAIYNSKRWPQWWPGVLRAEELQPGDQNGLGSVFVYTFRNALPYNLVFSVRTTKVEPPNRLEGEASGELEGTGRWNISQSDGVTTVKYYWDIRTTKRWLNLLAPLARPLFVWNHDVVMRQGGEGLARLLNAKLLEGDEKQTAGTEEAEVGVAGR